MSYGNTDECWDLAPVLYDHYISPTICPGILTTQPYEISIPSLPNIPEAGQFPTSSHLPDPQGAHFVAGSYEGDLLLKVWDMLVKVIDAQTKFKEEYREYTNKWEENMKAYFDRLSP